MVAFEYCSYSIDLHFQDDVRLIKRESGQKKKLTEKVHASVML